MTPRQCQRSILAGVLLGTLGCGTVGFGLIGSPSPAAAFEIFGIRLWGESTQDDAIEIIDPLPYTVVLTVQGGEEDLKAAMERASGLWSDRETPASGRSGLLAKARGDYRRLLAALYNSGYYGAEISIRLAGREVSELALDADLPPEVPVAIVVRPGPAFRFGTAAIVNAPPERVREDDEVDDAASVGFETGARARGTAVVAASALAIEQWRQLGRAKAREADRELIADHPRVRLDATIVLDPGAPARYGPTRVTGSQRVDPRFIAYMADLEEGDVFDPDDVTAAEERLGALGVFRAIRVEEAEGIGTDGALPMTVRVEDRRKRSFGVGATLSTIEGLGLEAYWLHRNLLGRAEQLRVEASISGLGVTTDPIDLDYNLGVIFTKPGVLNPDTAFETSVVARQLDLDTYRQTSLTGRAGLRRSFGDRLTGSIFAEVSRARFEDDFGTRNFLTVGLVGMAEYDRRDDPLDPTRGYFIAADLAPFYEAKFGNAALRGTLEGRIYRSLDADSRFVLAARTKVGSYQGPSAAESPPDLLFFAGGGGSVRGYAYRSIGVDFVTPDGETSIVGGRGLFEASGEVRMRITDRFGVVGFLDAGVVTADARLSGDNDVRVGTGLGVRYYTGLGPLRVDLATPVDPRDDDAAVALYIGIGQAF